MVSKKFIYEKTEFTTDSKELLLEETIFHSGNGYLGVRGAFEEGYSKGYPSIRGQYINGFYEVVDMPQAEKLHGLIEEKQTILNVADTQTIDITLAGEAFCLFEGVVKHYNRSLNMQEGIVSRVMEWCSPSGKLTEITIRRMASFLNPSLFYTEVLITPKNYSDTICFQSYHKGEVTNYADPDDPRVAGESSQYLFAQEPVVTDDVSIITAKTGCSKLTVCSGVFHTLTGGSKETSRYEIQRNSAMKEIQVFANQGETVVLGKYSMFGDSLHHEDAQNHVQKEMEKVRKLSAEKLYEGQRTFLNQFWENSSLYIDGEEELDLAVRYNQYQLLQSASRDGVGNIAAKGLSGEGYEGHYFWDTEMYIQPFFLLTNPDIVKSLLSYRHSILNGAKENAKALGHEAGALYPWRTISGEECSGYFPSGTAQYHISGDIAYAVVQYYLATGDLDFIREKGGEIVLETARLWADTAVEACGKYQIHEVTGPDEYTCMVSNNYYTNALAKYNLEWAVKFYEKAPKHIHASKEEIDYFRQVARNMYLPYDEKLGINPQDDSFLQKKKWDFKGVPKENYPLLLHYHPLCLYRHQVCKQADTVLSHMILEDYQSVETIRKSFDYYEQVTTHDSSLSACIFSIAASRLGLKEKAQEYFGESAKLDLFNTHGNTKDGIHTANMGGTYMAIVNGFAGLRIKEEGLMLTPILPKGWSGYRFCITYRGSRLLIRIDENGCDVSLLSGDAVKVVLNGEGILVDK